MYKNQQQHTKQKIRSVINNNWPKKVTCITSQLPPDIPNVSHGQPYYRLIFKTEGTQRISYPGENKVEELVMEPGDALLLAPGSWVYGHCERKHFNNLIIRCRDKYIELSENDEYSWPHAAYLYSFPFTREKSFKSEIISALKSAVEYCQQGSDLLCRSYSQLATALTYELLNCDIPTTISPSCRQVLRLQDLFNYVNSNFSQPLRKEELCQQFSTTSASLNRFFKEKTGTTFRSYLLQLRMEYACDLLCHPILSLSQVAKACSYSSSESFIHAFKKYYGKPPLQLRQDMLGGQAQIDGLKQARIEGFENLTVLPHYHLESMTLPLNENRKNLQLHFLNSDSNEVFLFEVIEKYRQYNHGKVLPGQFKRLEVKEHSIFIVKSPSENYLGCFQIGVKRAMVVYRAG